MPTKKIFGFPKNIFLLGLTSFFNDFSSEMVVSVFPAFFTSVLKTGAASLGLVEGIADGASNIFKIYSGHLSDKLQKRKFLVVIGYALSLVTRPFYLFAASVPSVLGLRFADRVGKGVREAPRDAIISFSTPKEHMGASFGFHRAMDKLGGILGPLAAYFILLYWPGQFNYVFIAAFFIGVFALIALIFITDVVLSSVHRFSLKNLSFSSIPPNFALYLFAIFLLSVGSMPVAVMLLKTQTLGLVIATIPLFYMVYNVASSGFAYIAGYVSDTVGTRKVIFAGYVVLLISYAVIGSAQNLEWLFLGFILFGLFPALTDGVQHALAAEISPEAMRGGAFGLLNAAMGVGAIFAGVGGGLLWEFYGPATALAVSSGVVLMGLVVFLSTAGKKLA